MTQRENPQRTPEEVRAAIEETLARGREAQERIEHCALHLDAGALAVLIQQVREAEQIQGYLNQFQPPSSPNLET